MKEIDDENVKVRTNKDSGILTLSKDILQTEMNSGHAFQKEEKVTRTQMIEILMNARESCMSIKFHKKVDDSHVKAVLKDNLKSAASFKDKKLLAQVASELVTGPDAEMTCCLTTSDNKLGRSNIIDLNAPYGMNFR